MRILHAVDIHLDSPMKGLKRYEGAPQAALRGATRSALENLVELALDEEVALVLLAGDLYDGDWTDFHTGQFLRHQLFRLREAGIPVVGIAGNHDAASKITRSLRLPENVEMLDCRKPQTIVFDQLGVAVHGQGYAKPATTSNLVAAYPDPVAGYFNIGLLHTSLEGREGHERYAPCALDDLLTKGYDYWALGHVHAREIVHEEPYVVFPGNLQGRHMRECGPKGATLVTVEDTVSIEHRTLDNVRFAVTTVDLGEAHDEEAVFNSVERGLGEELGRADGRLLAVRLVLCGSCPVHDRLAVERDRFEAEIQASACELAEERIWLERIAFETTAAVELDALRGGSDAVAEVVRVLDELREDSELAKLVEEFAPLAKKLPSELRGPDALEISDPTSLRRALDDVERTLLPALLERRP